MLDYAATASIGRLRQALESHGFLGPRTAEIMGSGFGPAPSRSDLPLYIRRLAAPDPLNVLIRLFGLYVPVTEAEARAALAPLGLEEAVSLGIVARDGDEVRSAIGLVTTGTLVLARDRFDDATGTLRPDHVLGLNPPALNLGRLTVRRRVKTALDVGCGGGVQALLASEHAAKVVAVDINPRALAFTRFNAALNGVTNVECRQGSFFEPVRGERFDLVVCNPPFTISPDSRYVFRDGGGEGDSVCETIVREAAAHLTEDGFATVLCNWALREGDEPSAPPRRWVDGSGCDAWILVNDVQDPLTYAAGWNRGTPHYASDLDRWVDYDRERGIAQIGMGAVILRRRSARASWVRVDRFAEGPTTACDGLIQRVFDSEDRLRDLTDDEALLGTAFRAAPDHEVHEVLVPRGGRYEVRRREIRLTAGLPFRGTADEHALELLRLCDGRRTLVDVLDEMAKGSDVGMEVLATGFPGAVRRLVAMGFLIPATRREKRGTDGRRIDVAQKADVDAAGAAPGRRRSRRGKRDAGGARRGGSAGEGGRDGDVVRPVGPGARASARSKRGAARPLR